MNDMTGVTRAKRDDGSKFLLESASPEELGFDLPALSCLRQLIASHIAEGRYPGAQIAHARHGRLALFESFGQTSLEPAAAAGAQALWLLFSNTKVITAAGIWALVEDGEPALRRTPIDTELAAAEIRASGWPPGEEFVTENLLTAQSRDAAIAHFEGLRT